MRIDRSNITPAVILTLALTAACTKVRPGQDSSPAIGFSPAVTTRAMIESSGDPAFSAFDVRAYSYLKAEDGTPADPVTVFDGETVTRSGSTWTYEGTRYWTPGRIYDFYAVFPSGVEHVTVAPPSAAATEGTVSITDFDAREKGPDGTCRDLMLAVTKDRSYDPATQPDGPETVQMAFTHLLSRLSLVCKQTNADDIADFEPKVYSARLYGMSPIGNFVSSGYEPDNVQSIRRCWTADKNFATTATDSYVSFSNDKGTLVDADEGLCLFQDVTAIPQTFSLGMFFEIEYSTMRTGNNIEPEHHNIRLDLTTLDMEAWEAGMHYVYTFSISPDGLILFDTPNVIPWDKATGSIIIVQ